MSAGKEEVVRRLEGGGPLRRGGRYRFCRLDVERKKKEADAFWGSRHCR